MRTISILNFKGGTGKSSLAENLSYALAQLGQRVLVIDADRQGNSSTTLLACRMKPTLTNVIKGEVLLEKAIKQAHENLYVVPSDSNLDRASSHLNERRAAYYTLQKSVQRLTDFDYLFIDHAGAYTPVMEAALLASNEMLIPCELEGYAVQGLFSMFAKLEDALPDHAIHNSGIIPYNVDMRYTMARQYLNELRTEFGDLVSASIRTDSTVPRAQSLQMTVFEYEAAYGEKSRAAEDYKALAADLIEEAQEARL